MSSIPSWPSRVELAQAVSQPGFFVESASSAQQAVGLLDEFQVSLILVDHNLDERRGLEILTELRQSHPQTRRALLTELQDLEAIRGRLDAAELSFVVKKPWDPKNLREKVSSSLTQGSELPSWRTVSVASPSSRPVRPDVHHRIDAIAMPHREILVRGLLAGLNACETEASLFRLVHAELATGLGASSSLWLNDSSNRLVSLQGGEAMASELDAGTATSHERRVLAAARALARGSLLEASEPTLGNSPQEQATIGFPFRVGQKRVLTLAMSLPVASAEEALTVLEALQSGVGMALDRIAQTHDRAEAARRLARRVSDELRNPVGALTNAIAVLRSDVERAGMSSDNFDRVTSESERVVRAVRTIEHELRVDPRERPAGSFKTR